MSSKCCSLPWQGFSRSAGTVSKVSTPQFSRNRSEYSELPKHNWKRANGAENKGNIDLSNSCTHTGSRSGAWRSGGERTAPFCSGGCKSSSQQSSPGSSLGRRHSPTSEREQTRDSPYLKKHLLKSAGGKDKPLPDSEGPSEARPTPALGAERPQTGGCPALPCPVPSRPSPVHPHPLPARREAAPGAAPARPGAGPSSSLQQPPSPGCPRLSPPPPFSQPFRFLGRCRKLLCTDRRTDPLWSGEVAEAEVSWGHFRGADVEGWGGGGGGAEGRGGARC